MENNYSEILVNELIEDMKNLRHSILSFEDRWSSYGNKIYDNISDEKKKEIFLEFDKFKKSMLKPI